MIYRISMKNRVNAVGAHVAALLSYFQAAVRSFQTVGFEIGLEFTNQNDVVAIVISHNA